MKVGVNIMTFEGPHRGNSILLQAELTIWQMHTLSDGSDIVCHCLFLLVGIFVIIFPWSVVSVCNIPFASILLQTLFILYLPELFKFFPS
jgi:hypothetical protein